MRRAALWSAVAMALFVAGLAVSRALTRVEPARAAGLALTAEPGPTAEPEEILALIEDLAAEERGRHRPAYERLVEIGQPAVPYLAAAVKDRRREVRRRSVQALGAIGGDDVVAPLMAALSDQDALVRRYAVHFVGKWGGGNAAAIPAVRALLADPDLDVVVGALWAADALGDISHKSDLNLVDSLCADLKSEDERRRELAAIALGMIGHSRAAVPLAEALASGPSAGVRMAIVEAIGKIGCTDAAPLLLELLKHEKTLDAVRDSAAEALRLLGDPSLNDELLELTRSPHSSVRGAAAYALGFEGNSAAVERLSEIASDTDESAYARMQAVESLVEIGDPRGAPAIGVALSDEDQHLRLVTARALDTCPFPAAVPYLVRALEHPEPHPLEPSVVTHCAYALARTGDESAAVPLFRLFSRDDALQSTPSSMSGYINIATAAHNSLLILTGETSVGDWVRTPEELQQVRAMWRQRLGLAEDE